MLLITCQIKFRTILNFQYLKAHCNLTCQVIYDHLNDLLSQLVTGSGPDGRVRAVDIESFDPASIIPAAAAPAYAAPAPIPGDGFTDIPLSNMRKVKKRFENCFYHVIFIS